MTRKNGLILAVALQTLVLFGMIANKQYTLLTGTEVVLEMKPVDPRSLFRGDYVRLSYDISIVNPNQLAGDDKFSRGDRIHVRLKKKEPGPHTVAWIPVSLHHRRPAPSPSHIVITGKVAFVADLRRRLSVRYGIESYFVPEDEGRALERPKPGEIVTVRLAIDRFGRSAIKAVLIDGKPRYTESLF